MDKTGTVEGCETGLPSRCCGEYPRVLGAFDKALNSLDAFVSRRFCATALAGCCVSVGFGVRGTLFRLPLSPCYRYTR